MNRYVEWTVWNGHLGGGSSCSGWQCACAGLSLCYPIEGQWRSRRSIDPFALATATVQLPRPRHAAAFRSGQIRRLPFSMISKWFLPDPGVFKGIQRVHHWFQWELHSPPYILNYNLNSIRFEWMKLTFNGMYLAKYGYLNYKIESFPLNNLTPEFVHSASKKRL